MRLPEIQLVPTADPLSAGASGIAVPLYAGGALGAGAAAVAAALGDVTGHLERDGAKGEPGELHAFSVNATNGAGLAQVFLVGLGARDAVTPAILRKAGGALARRAAKLESLASTVGGEGGAAGLQAFAEGLLLGSYSFQAYKSTPKEAKLQRIELHGRRATKATESALHRAEHRARATWLARDLVNTPSGDKTPAWFAKRAQEAAERAGLVVTVLEPGELAAQGFGGILAVGQGSTRGPRLVRVDYVPDRQARRHAVLIGKGITFDSGGLSLKTNDGMRWMKTDMSGGAAVLATLQALPELDIPVRVTGLVPLAENLPSGTAQRPGDVIRHYGGQTSEVLNTDAEGRLVLADALAFASRELRPDYIVDVATLTGAATLALGVKTAALFSNDDRLAARLLTAGEAAGERLWRLPLVEDYRHDLDSEIADLRNIGTGAFSGGAITAALFLREFVGDRRWAHLDIAGPARAESDDDEVTKGGTGFGVRTLLTWLDSLS